MERAISILLFGLSALALAVAIDKRKARRRAWQMGGMDGDRKQKFTLAACLAMVSRYMPDRVLNICVKACGKKSEPLIIAAGLGDIIDEKFYFTAKICAALSCAILFPMIIKIHLPMQMLIGLAIGWIYVDIWISGRARFARESIEMELPNALDWLSLSVEAGLDFAEALGRVSSRIKKGRLKDELIRLDSAIRMGMPRREALCLLKKRTNVPALKSFAATLIQADALGASIGPVLRTTSARLRDERFSRAERKGAAAAQKALVPLAFCIMPATFVVVFGPLVVKLATGGFNSLF